MTAEPITAQIEIPKVPKVGDIIAKKIATADKITRDHITQIRGRIDSSKVKEYEVIIREQGEMDPLDVFTDGSATDKPVFYLADGWHRMDAYAAAGVEKFKIHIRLGSKSDAIRFALQRNGRHGAQMTNTEKRHAAETAVQDPEIGNSTDKEIAALIGCSPSLVSEARRGITRDVKRKKRKDVEVESHHRSAPGTASSGKRETESPAPKSATARERTPADTRPTKAMILKQISDYLIHDVIDEEDLIKLMESKDSEYKWVKKAGTLTTLRVVGKSGREQINIPVVVKNFGLDLVEFRNEGEKLLVHGLEA